MIRQTVAGAIRQIGAREVRVRMCSRTLGRDSLIVEPAGIDLTDFRRNPIILRDHDQSKPVARAVGFDQRPDALEALIRFATANISPLADETHDLVRDGVISAVSIGFEPLEQEPINPRDRSAGTRIKRATLLECSFVGVPADPQALVIERSYRRQAMMLDDLREDLEEALSHHADVARALRRGETAEATRAHRRLGQSLKNIGMSLDQLNSSKSQTSSGVSWGSSDGHGPKSLEAIDRPRAALSLAQRQADLRALTPRPPVLDGSAIGLAALRGYEFQRALAHTQACAAGGACYRAPTKAERQAEAERLRRIY
jgi:HK97 family phage prohead protease